MIPDYEAWREALIAFYEAESPYLPQRAKNLRMGFPLSNDDRRTIEGLIVAGERTPKAPRGKLGIAA